MSNAHTPCLIGVRIARQALHADHYDRYSFALCAVYAQALILPTPRFAASMMRVLRHMRADVLFSARVLLRADGGDAAMMSMRFHMRRVTPGFCASRCAVHACCYGANICHGDIRVDDEAAGCAPACKDALALFYVFFHALLSMRLLRHTSLRRKKTLCAMFCLMRDDARAMLTELCHSATITGIAGSG